MYLKDFFWQYFEATGRIGPYLIYKNLLEEGEEYSSSWAVLEEE